MDGSEILHKGWKKKEPFFLYQIISNRVRVVNEHVQIRSRELEFECKITLAANVPLTRGSHQLRSLQLQMVADDFSFLHIVIHVKYSDPDSIK